MRDRRYTIQALVLIAAGAVALLVAGCTADSRVGVQSVQAGSFSELAILPTLEFAGAPQVILASAEDFRDIWQEVETDRVFGRMDPETGSWLDFALVLNGVFYVLPADGFHTPADILDAEKLQVPSAESYYQIQRRSIPSYRYRSYFLN
jgi:hypothetical protein